jgi:methyltransferase (TIGR00027 family)
MPTPDHAHSPAGRSVFARSRWSTLPAVIRTRFFDDYLLAACTAGCRQVVLLAAGLDTRAFRLGWPDGVHVFEVDLPDVQAFKERVLAGQAATPQCARSVVEADLTGGDWPASLGAAGFDSSARCAWLPEGLLIYLTAPQAAGLLAAVGQNSAPGSRLAFEHSSGGSVVLREARAVPGMQEFTSLWRGGLGEEPSRWLARHGWRASFHDGAAAAAAYGRADPDYAGGGFISAVRGG